jgi:hypothetical protein
MPRGSLIKAEKAAEHLGTGAAAKGRDAILKRKKELEAELAKIMKDL